MIERAVVLAAGRGRRLGSITDETPKPLIEVGGTSLIRHVLGGLRAAGIYEVIIVTGYRSAEVEDHIWGEAGMSIRFVRQDALLGTGHALGLASRYLRDRMFLYTWADVLVDPLTYRKVILAIEQADAVIAINEVDDPSEGAAVTIDDQGWVTDIVEKPDPRTSDTRWNNSGVGILGPEAWRLIDRLEPSDRGELELTDALRAMVKAGALIRAVPVTGTWFDIGTPQQLAAAREVYGS